MIAMITIFRGIIIPAKAVEGKISIVDTVGVNGDDKQPVLASPVKQGDAVKIVGDDGEYVYISKATDASDVIVGFAHDHPEYDFDPAREYTEAQAKNAGVLRKVGVETVFSDVRTVPCKADEAISAGDYVEWSPDGFKKSATTTNNICIISPQDEMIVVGLK